MGDGGESSSHLPPVLGEPFLSKNSLTFNLGYQMMQLLLQSNNYTKN